MSAIWLPKVHIDALLTAALQWGDGEFPWRRDKETAMFTISRDTADEFGAAMWRQNYDNAEGYDEYDDPPPGELDNYTYDELPGTADPLAVLAAITSYVYQTGDDPESYDGSDADCFLRALRSEAIPDCQEYTANRGSSTPATSSTPPLAPPSSDVRRAVATR